MICWICQGSGISSLKIQPQSRGGNIDVGQKGQVGLIRDPAIDCAGWSKPPPGPKLARWLDVQTWLARFLYFLKRNIFVKF